METHTELLQRVQGRISKRHNHSDLQELWKDIHTTLIRPALAKLLPGVQGKVQIDGNGNENVQRVWKKIYLSILCSALAALLPGVSGE